MQSTVYIINKVLVKHHQNGTYKSACKPALIQDTDYMVEKTYHLAPYLSSFRTYLIPQCTVGQDTPLI